MSASAVRTGASDESAAEAAAQALANVQTVASAAEQLTASIREIGGQVGQSSTVVGRAVEAGRITRETIGALNEQVGRIGGCRHDQRNRCPHQSARPERHHRGGKGRRCGQGIRSGRQRGEAACHPDREVDRGNQPPHRRGSRRDGCVGRRGRTYRGDHRRDQRDRRFDRRGSGAARRGDRRNRPQCHRDRNRGKRDDQPDARGVRRSRAHRAAGCGDT